MKLEQIQLIMQSAIIAPDADAEHDDRWIEAELLGSPTMTAIERLEIYRGMFQNRVIDSLIDDYPLLHQFLADDMFANLSLAYIGEYPSRTFTLEKIGDNFAAFVSKQEWLLREIPFAADLARLEFALVQAFHAKETAVLTSSELDPMAVESWMAAKLQPVPSASLLACDYDVNGIYSAFQQDRVDYDLGIPALQSYVLIWKFQDENWRLSLDQLSYQFLAQIFAGQTMASAVDHILTIESDPEKLQEVFECFTIWMNDGVFCEDSAAVFT